MKRMVLTFGLIAGAILSATLLLALPFRDAIGFDRGEVLGYTSMVLAFLLIFFGVRSYRDTIGGGRVGFGRAFAVGALIAVVASLCYVATWEVILSKLAPDYMTRYQAHVLDKARADGANAEAIARKKAEMDKLAALYKNPAISAAITFLEPLPVAVIVALVSAGVLSRQRKRRAEEDGMIAGARTST